MIKAEIFLPQSVNVEKLEGDLRKVQVESVSEIDMRLFGQEERTQEKYRGVERVIRNSQKTKVEIVMKKDAIADVIQIIKARVDQESLKNVKMFTSPLQITSLNS